MFQLPPGWSPVLDDAGRLYFSDWVLNCSTWDPPVPYKDMQWRRKLENGRGHWESKMLDMHFYEGDSSWQRMQSSNSRKFWTSSDGKVRFYEKELQWIGAADLFEVASFGAPSLYSLQAE